MFTGIIESSGIVRGIDKRGSNVMFTVQSPISHELKVDQSLSHNGVCLTITGINDDVHFVTAVEETLEKSTLGSWRIGSKINLERCMLANSRFDGHIVQGHVDQKGRCVSVEDKNGSWLFNFEYDSSAGNITVEKGSICVDGVSLTCFNSSLNRFSVAIIPYTFEHTNFEHLKAGDEVNLEFDIVGKYIRRIAQMTPEK